MPKFTARVFVMHNQTAQEEIWLEDIRATDATRAQNKVAVKMHNYIQQHKGGDNPPNGYKVIFCILSDMLDGATKMPHGDIEDVKEEKQALMTPLKATKEKVKVIHMKLNEKMFKEEIKGDFSDPYDFKESVSLKTVKTYYSGYNNHRF